MAVAGWKIHRAATRIPGRRVTHIAEDEYNRIIDLLPILCVDIAVQNERGEYLLVKRSNPPKQHHWWVVGGRVQKGERLELAAGRKLTQEVGLPPRPMRAIGYMELTADEHPFGLPTDYHAVSIVFQASASAAERITLDDQSAEWRWAPALPSDFPLRKFEGSP